MPFSEDHDCKPFSACLFILQFFFRVWQIVTQDKCFEPLKRNLQKWTWNTEILRNPKQLSFWRCTENKICYIHKISEITKKLGVTVFNFHKLLFRGPKLLPWVKICHAQKKYWSTNKKVTSGLFEYSVKLVSSFHPWNPALCKTDAFSPFY